MGSEWGVLGGWVPRPAQAIAIFSLAQPPHKVVKQEKNRARI